MTSVTWLYVKCLLLLDISIIVALRQGYYSHGIYKDLVAFHDFACFVNNNTHLHVVNFRPLTTSDI